MTEIPDDLLFSSEHEWVRVGNKQVARVGVSAYATSELGDIVYVSLPEVGATVTAGEPCGEVESTKSVSEIYAPVTGEVVAVNAVLSDAPETVNAQPYDDGWMVQVRIAGEPEGTLDAAGYRALIGE